MQELFPRTANTHALGVAGDPDAVAVVSMLQHVLLDWPEAPEPLTRQQGEVLRSILSEARMSGWDANWAALELAAWGN